MNEPKMNTSSTEITPPRQNSARRDVRNETLKPVQLGEAYALRGSGSPGTRVLPHPRY